MLILASASPRRRELLTQLGAEFTIQATGIPEIPRGNESPRDFVCRAAREKAQAVRASDAFVLGADTIVTINELILGKPEDEADAERMLRMLSGREHHVLTAVALANPAGEICDSLLADTCVAFRSLSTEEIRDYVDSGEPQDKAGAYAIQGLAGAFVTEMRGSYTNVVGLPIDEVAEILRRHGLLRAAIPSPA